MEPRHWDCTVPLRGADIASEKLHFPGHSASPQVLHVSWYLLLPGCRCAQREETGWSPCSGSKLSVGPGKKPPPGHEGLPPQPALPWCWLQGRARALPRQLRSDVTSGVCVSVTQRLQPFTHTPVNARPRCSPASSPAERLQEPRGV